MLQLVYITATFNDREGHHSDENWDYGFANSTDGGYISRYGAEDYPSLEEWPDGTKNFDEWTSSKVLHDYLTVQPDERFSYVSVLQNRRFDTWPPLHSLILNTICSFFPDTFSWWYSYAINVVCFIVMQVFLFLLGRLLFRSDWLALALVAFYGFSLGALNCFVYLRPYALANCLIAIFCYLNLRLMRCGFQRCRGTYAALTVVTFLGAMDYVFFIMFAAAMMICFCIYLGVQKKHRLLVPYVLCICGACFAMVLINIDTFRALVYHHSTYGVTGSLDDVAMSFTAMCREVFGILPSDGLWAIAIVFGVTVAIAAALYLLGRNGKRLGGASRAIGGFFARIRGKLQRSAHEPQNSFWYWLILFTTTAVCFVVIARSVAVSTMGEYVDRYFFFLMLCICILFVWVVWQIAYRLPIERKAHVAVLVCCLVLASSVCHLQSGCNYLFERHANYDSTIQETTKDADVVLVTCYDWRLVYWTSILQDSNAFFAMTAVGSDEHTDALNQVPDDGKPVYLVMEIAFFPRVHDQLDTMIDYKNFMAFEYNTEAYDNSDFGYTFSDYLAYMREQPWVNQTTYVGAEEGFAGNIVIVRLR